jgi:hypothetical protein
MRTAVREGASKTKAPCPIEDWRIVVKDRYPAYIDWPTYEKIRKRSNHPTSTGGSGARGGVGPGHQLVDAGGGPAVDELGERIGHPGERIDQIQLARLCRTANYAEHGRFPHDSQ